MVSDSRIACAGFCGLPLVVILLFALLYQLVNLESFQNFVTRCFPESEETVFGKPILKIVNALKI